MRQCGAAPPPSPAADHRRAEFFTRFTPPKTKAKWLSRLKCNGAYAQPGVAAARAESVPAYYYRVNYICLILLIFVVAILRRPTAFLAVAFAAFSLLCLNDSFAHTVRCAAAPAAPAAPAPPRLTPPAPSSDRAVRLSRKIHPPLSIFLRNPSAVAPPGGKAYAKNKVVYLLGQDRRVVVAVLLALSFLMLLLTGAVGTVMRTLGLAGGLVLLHASLRSPNLKARLNSYNEEFR